MRLHTTNINFITLIILISLLFLLYSCNYNYPKYEHEVLNIIHHKQDLTEKIFLSLFQVKVVEVAFPLRLHFSLKINQILIIP